MHTTAVQKDRGSDRVPLLIVLVLLFLISWIGMVPQVYASWNGPASVPGWMKSLQLFILAPAFVTLIVAAINGGTSEAKALLRSLFRWRAAPMIYTGVILGPPILIAGAILLSNSLGLSAVEVPGTSATFAKFLSTFLVYFVLNTEELAWRGYVLPRFLRRWSPLRASLILGIIWALFHSPYFLMKGGHPGGFSPIVFVMMVIGLALIFTRLFAVTGGSVLLPHLLHQSVNAWGEALPVLPRFAGSPSPAVIAVSGMMLALVVLLAANRRYWMRREGDMSLTATAVGLVARGNEAHRQIESRESVTAHAREAKL